MPLSKRTTSSSLSSSSSTTFSEQKGQQQPQQYRRSKYNNQDLKSNDKSNSNDDDDDGNNNNNNNNSNIDGTKFIMTKSQSDNNNEFWIKVAATMGASGVALGALGAHALKETLTKHNSLAAWNTATVYQLFHATALLGLAHATVNNNNNNSKACQRAGTLWSVGTLLFSGSIYCLSLKIGPRPILGPITPIGGLLMIGGWVAAGWS